MLEDVVDGSDGAAGLSSEVAGLQRRKPFFGDGAFGDISQLPAQRGVPVGVPHDHSFFERCSNFT